MYTTKRPIRTLADARGMKIRVQQSDLWVSLLEAMHANATPMPWGEVYTALKTGLVDGAENNWPSYESSRQFEVAKYYSLTEHSMAPEMLLFSKRDVGHACPRMTRRWCARPPRTRCRYMRKLWDEREQKSRKMVEAAGVQIISVDKTSFQAAMKPVYDRFITSAQMKDLVRRAQDTKYRAPSCFRPLLPRQRRWTARPGRAPAPVSGAGGASFYTRFCATLARACMALGVTGLVLLVIAVLTQVFGRYVLNDTPTWAETIGHAARALRDDARHGGGRARRRPHRPGVPAGAAAGAHPDQDRAADPRAGLCTFGAVMA